MWHVWGGERCLQGFGWEARRPLGRPRRRWEDNIKMDVGVIGIDGANWIQLAQDRVQWRALWTRWWTFGFRKKAGYFLTSWETISFSNNILHHGVSEWVSEWVSK
jgi:hypothetical protein